MEKMIYNCKPILGILLGDASGVGPEIVAKVAAKGALNEYCRPIIIGDIRVLQRAMELVNVDFNYCVIETVEEISWDRGIPVLDQNNIDPKDVKMAEINPKCGKVAGDMLIKAIDLYKQGKIHGFCFAPLNKAAMKQGGHDFESEQYLFSHYFNQTGPFGEMNVLENLWTSRVTSHIPIKDVSIKLTEESILKSIDLAHNTLKRAGIENPRVAVAALNPHGGENGLCGIEEIEIIMPAINKAIEKGMDINGPIPADILFIKAFEGEYDAVVTMYHDQGQIAMKLKGFDYGITVASGFPAPIVTCAHGTAFDIAGKGIAKTTAFENAIKMAAKIAINDMKNCKHIN